MVNLRFQHECVIGAGVKRGEKRRGPREVALALCDSSPDSKSVDVVRCNIEDLIQLAGGGRGQSELLHHVIAREARRLAVNCRRDFIALFTIETGSFNTKRRQRDPSAAASSALFFCHC